METDRVHLVVGDDNAVFAENRNVVTVAALMKSLRTSFWQGDEVFVLGQGITEHTRKLILSALEDHNLTTISGDILPVSLELTHKHRRENVLISGLRRVAEKRYDSDFMFGNEEDRLCDHVTGQHVGAMLLQEAARQASIASLEMEYQRGDTHLGIVVERFTSQFFAYAFPLPTVMRTRIEELDTSDKHIPVICTVSFEQAGKVICEMCLEGGVFQRDYLKLIERRQAKRALKSVLDQYADTAEAELVAE